MAHECEYCGRQFPRSFNLKRHIEMMHNRHYEDNSDMPHTSDGESVDNDSSNDNEHDSTLETSTESSAEDESDTDFLNDDEFASYRKILDSFMMKPAVKKPLVIFIIAFLLVSFSSYFPPQIARKKLTNL